MKPLHFILALFSAIILFFLIMSPIKTVSGESIAISTEKCQFVDNAILAELEDMNETLRDIRGLLEKVAENTRK